MSLRIECILECDNHLGEGPIWDDATGLLYWLDCTGRRVRKPSIWRLDPRTGDVANWSVDRDIGSMALRKNGGAVLALDDGFYFFEFESGELEPIHKIPGDVRVRMNDGKCDRRGRFIAGGMDDKEELAICSLWRLDPDLRVSKLDDGIICTNGPCWSPDDRTFYVADSFSGEYRAYDYDIYSGAVSNKRVFATFANDRGVADGSTVDEQGYLWNAQIISGELIRYAPDGSVDRRIGMPVRNITSVIFGGSNLDELYVTSMARVKHPAAHDQFAVEVRPQYLAGALFKVTGLGVRGLPEPRFAG